jgi:GNAT superfamily N-acetyltransferase
MLVVLQASSNYARPQRLQLRANQVAKVGRSEWAEFSFSGDPVMADVQFEIRSTADVCTIVSLSKEPPTLVNGKEIERAEIHDGDQIDAGETRFLVHLEVERSTVAPRTVAPTDTLIPTLAPAAAIGATALTLAATCAYLGFSEDVNELAATAKTPDALIDELAKQGKVQDALRLRAHLLPKRQAVWWGCLCVRQDVESPFPAPQVAALEAAEDWVREPDEDHRRVAEKRSEEAKYSGVGATLALSAFWSEGSIAPDGIDDVVADERLTSQGVAAALISAAYHGDPSKATKRTEAFLAKGKDMANGKIPLPERDPDK